MAQTAARLQRHDDAARYEAILAPLASAFNKRIMSMLIERLKDQVQLFEKEFLVAAVAV